MRVFLDANVLFAASNPNSPTGHLVRLLLEIGEAVTCEYAREEARRNVEIKWPARLDDLEKLIAAVETASTHQFPLSVKLPAKDIPILCAAIRANCQYLATGDRRDFGHLFDKTVDGVTVITLLRLAEILVKQREKRR